MKMKITPRRALRMPLGIQFQSQIISLMSPHRQSSAAYRGLYPIPSSMLRIMLCPHLQQQMNSSAVGASSRLHQGWDLVAVASSPEATSARVCLCTSEALRVNGRSCPLHGMGWAGSFDGGEAITERSKMAEAIQKARWSVPTILQRLLPR